MNEWDVINGDCLSVMRDMPTGAFSAFVTDPPYSTAGGATNGRTLNSGAASADFFAYWLRSVAASLAHAVRPDGCGFVFCDWRTADVVRAAFSPDGSRTADESWRVSQMLVWDRESIGMGDPFRNGFEMIAFVRGPKYRSELPKNISNVIRHRYPYGGHKHHGAEKPVDLVSKLIGWATAGQAEPRVLDPFAGSGTTIVAARALGIAATGIELLPSVYATARDRAGLPADRVVRDHRLAAGRCPECGSDVEWSLHSSIEGATSSAYCTASDRALRLLATPSTCEWSGRVRRVGPTVRLEDARP